MTSSQCINLMWIGIFIFLISACGEQEKPPVPETIRPVKYGKVMMSRSALNETFSGSAQSSKQTNISFKVGGVVTRLNVKVGDLVRKGQLIAKIDQTDYSVQYQQSVANNKSAETQIQSAKTQLISSKATYERVEKLYENNSLSISEFEQAKSSYELAQSSYDAALSQASASGKQVESAQNQVRYSTLLSPFSGVISALMVEENEMVGSGTPIATITSMENPEILVGIPEVFIAQISKNQKVNIFFSSMPDKPYSGKVYEVGYSSLGGSTYPVTIRIDNPSLDIRPGMSAEVHFHFGEGSQQTEKMVTPTASVGEDDDSHYVFALNQDGNAYVVSKKKIKIGALTTAGFEVLSGLSNGDIVATAGLNTLLDGMKVRLMD